MNVKDFIFSLNKEKLFEQYYKDFYLDDFIFNAESEKNGISQEERKKLVYNKYNLFMEELYKLKLELNDKEYYLLPLSYYDYNINDDLSYEIYKIYDIAFVKLEEISKIKYLNKINSIEEISKNTHKFETYSLIFVSWEETLSRELLFIPEEEDIQYGCISFLLHELTWFGYDKQTAIKNEKIEREKLERAIEESKDPENLTEFNIDSFCEYFGCEKPSEAENRLQKKLSNEIIIKNYNERVAILNKYYFNKRSSL